MLFYSCNNMIIIINTFRMGLYRDAEKQFKSSLTQQSSVESALFLGKVCFPVSLLLFPCMSESTAL